ncbi:hypothetical protein D3C77_692300 [compost metagenome]
MSKSLRNKELTLIMLAKNDPGPLAVGWGALANIKNDIVDGSSKYTNKLGLGFGIKLVVQAA